MPDFTSALYLGLTHASQSLPGWGQLTLGKPAMMANPPGAEQLAGKLARLQGADEAVLLPSTLHLFFDVFETFGSARTAIFLDSASYPIARWGAERMTGRGVPLVEFDGHDPRHLRRLLASRARNGLRPLVVADGLCPGTGRLAPLGDYLEAVRHFGGLLLVDDTQGLGLLGSGPNQAAPYGSGGGGSLRFLGLAGPDILCGASLAKSFGVPMAVFSGSSAMLQRFRLRSLSRVHCSPPSVAVIQSADRALVVNEQEGDRLRSGLLANLHRLRQGLATLGFSAEGGLFPLQTLRPIAALSAASLHQALLARGVKTLLLNARKDPRLRLGLVITARHREYDIDLCLEQLDAVIRRSRIGVGRIFQ